jgi:hypothetical protein
MSKLQPRATPVCLGLTSRYALAHGGVLSSVYRQLYIFEQNRSRNHLFADSCHAPVDGPLDQDQDYDHDHDQDASACEMGALNSMAGDAPANSMTDCVNWVGLIKGNSDVELHDGNEGNSDYDHERDQTGGSSRRTAQAL